MNTRSAAAQEAHRLKKKVKDFLQSPLLLEQYEAQIFSIIRSHLSGGLSDESGEKDGNLQSSSMQDDEIVEKTYELILGFISLPICKD